MPPGIREKEQFLNPAFLGLRMFPITFLVKMEGAVQNTSAKCGSCGQQAHPLPGAGRETYALALTPHSPSPFVITMVETSKIFWKAMPDYTC